LVGPPKKRPAETDQNYGIMGIHRRIVIAGSIKVLIARDSFLDFHDWLTPYPEDQNEND
jgi:hypothetical protein